MDPRPPSGELPQAARPARISIVTPSYQQAAFLEDTLLSVLGQGVPDLEHIVMDGGSDDGSVAILGRYAPRLAHWQSARDGGQAAAINAGFARATGDVLGWLNSDDMYLPGTLAHAARRLDPGRPQIVFGNCLHFREGARDASGTDAVACQKRYDLAHYDYISQPSSFWTRAAWELTGPLDESLHFGFDWEWFLRARAAGVEIVADPRYLAIYRLHDAHKTGSGGERRDRELAEIYRRHGGERLATLFRALAGVRPRIHTLKRYVLRGPMSRAAVPLCRAMLPRALAPYADREIDGVLAMI